MSQDIITCEICDSRTSVNYGNEASIICINCAGEAATEENPSDNISPTKETKKSTVTGIGGWLLVFLVFYLLFTLGTFLGTIQSQGATQLALGTTFLINIYLLYLFVEKKLLFKTLIVFFFPLFTLLRVVIEGGPYNAAGIFGQFVGAGIWVLYFIKSDRVKNTFIG